MCVISWWWTIIHWYHQDGIVKCACHGQTCLEIKCPFSISHKGPTDPDIKLPFLKMIKIEQKLNQNRKYCIQYQQGMAKTGTKKYCFFVYTWHEFYLEDKILFDGYYWCYLKSLLIGFYAEIYLPSILQ